VYGSTNITWSLTIFTPATFSAATFSANLPRQLPALPGRQQKFDI